MSATTMPPKLNYQPHTVINSIIISSLVVVLLSTTIRMLILLQRQSMLTSGLTSSTKE
nr:MAG TPA_asm: hypothetical protein [Bacteriophage sp.]